MGKRNNNKIAALILLVYSMLTRFLTSIYSIRFDKELITGDGAIFYIVGKAIMQGKVLYKDIFDHKTPYIYFINGLASIIDYNHIGLFIVVVLILFISLFFIYKVLILIFDHTDLKNGVVINDNQKYVISMVGAFIMGILLCNSDMTEGYCKTEPFAVALILPAVFLMAKYYYNITNLREIPKQMFVIGILAGLTFMINLKGIVLFVPLVIPLTFDFIKQKQWVCLLKTFFFGLLGVIVAILPYVIYMFVTDSVTDMVYAVLDTNLAYANDYIVYDVGSKTIVGSISSKDGILAYIIAYTKSLPVIMILIYISFILAFTLNYNKRFKIAICIQFIVSFVFMTLVGRPHIYYLYVLLPFVIIIYLFAVKLFINKLSIFFTNVKIKLSRKIVIVIFFVLTLAFNYVLNVKNINETVDKNKKGSEVFKSIVKQYDADYTKLKVFGLRCMPEIYIWLDADIHYKYFILPFMTYNSFSKAFDEQVEYVSRGDPDILYFRNFDLFPKHLENQIKLALKNYYYLVGETDEYYVFGKKRQ